MTTVHGTPTTGTGASGVSFVVTPTSGTVVGDVVLVLAVANGGTTGDLADNNGATPFARSESLEAGSGAYLAVFSRRLQSGDPSTYSFTNIPDNRFSWICITLRDPHATDIFDVAPTAATPIASGTTINAPSINTVNANAIWFTLAGPDGAANAITGHPSGAGFTDDGNVVTNQTIAAAHKVIASPGATGTHAYTFSNAAACAFSLAIRDEGSAPSVNDAYIVIQKS